MKRSDPFSYALGFALCAIGIYTITRTSPANSHQATWLAYLPFALAILYWAWVGSFKLKITANGITFGQLFRPTRTIAFDDVLKASHRYGADETMTNIDSMDRLVIWHKLDPDRPYIVVNLKMFRRADIKELLQAIKPYLD